MLKKLVQFPETVNETSARLVAGGVIAQAVAFLIVRQWWILAVLAVGFLARVASGPRFSPLARLVTQVLTPAIAHVSGHQGRIVPGPPKRFAQFIGALFSVSATIACLVGSQSTAVILIIGLTAAASLEAFAGYCLGCAIFAQLMRIGVVPESVCVECNDISRRLGEGALSRRAA